MGLLLKERYKKIVLVKPNKINSHYGKRDAYLTLSSNTFKKPLQRELAYIESSPNYCDRDAQNRIPGTTERVCNRTSTDEDSCKLLCCGRGYNTHEIVRRYRCHCKFHWCCYVKCNKCKERMEVLKCKWELLQRKKKWKKKGKKLVWSLRLPVFLGKDLSRSNKPVATVEQIWWFTIDHWWRRQLNKNEPAASKIYGSHDSKYLQLSHAWAMVVHGNPKKTTEVYFALSSFV